MIKRSVLLSFIEQGFASLGTIAMTAGMIALTTPAIFGQFIFIFTLVLIAASLQYGLVGLPILTEIRPLDPAARPAALTMLRAFDFYYRLAASVIVTAASLAVTSDPDVIAAAGLFTFIYLWRETTRYTLFATDDPDRAVALGAVGLALFLPALAVFFLTGPTPFAPLAAFAIANAAALTALARDTLETPGTPRDSFVRYRQRFPRTGWSLGASAANEVQTRYHVVAVQMMRGVDQLGILEAGRVLFAPLFLIGTAWQRVAQPQTAAYLAAGDMAEARRLTFTGVGLVAGVAAAYCAVIYVLFGLIAEKLFGDRFGDVTPFVIGWGIYSVALLSNWLLLGHLNAARAYHKTALVTAAAAAATAAALFVLLFDVPLIYALGVLILVQAAVLMSALVLIFSMAPSEIEAAARSRA